MSNVYATEPATSGSVKLETTRGPIVIQLWCRECPETTRIFLQLCLDGFFDNMIFHRIMPQFLIQTGALRFPEKESGSISMEDYRNLIRADSALERRRYELHSRLRFNHRGQVAMALTVDNQEEDDEVEVQPQFFITLDEAQQHLAERQHVIFGKVEAPTIFNAIKIGEHADIDETTHQPVGDLEHAPRILSAKILDNPIHTNLVPQPVVPWRAAEQQQKAARKKKKRKGKRDINVLSFGDEVDNDESLFGGSTGGMKSSHDVLQSKTLGKKVDARVEDVLQQQEESVAPPASKKKLVSAKVETDDDRKKAAKDDPLTDDSAKKPPAKKAAPAMPKDDEENLVEYESEEEPLPPSARASEAPKYEKERNDRPPERAAKPTPPDKSSKPAKKQAKQHVSAVEARRAKYTKGRKSSKREREDDTMERLFAFQSKVRQGVADKKAKQSKKDDKENSLASRMARRAAQEAGSAADQDDGPITYHGQVLESDGEVEQGDDWLNTRFKCRRHMDHQSKEATRDDLGGDGRDMNDYQVIDEANREKTSSRFHHHHSHSGRSSHHHKRHKDSRHDRRRR